jgi:hypothetical protein
MALPVSLIQLALFDDVRVPSDIQTDMDAGEVKQLYELAAR